MFGTRALAKDIDELYATAAAEIAKRDTEIERLRDMIDNRNEFIAQRGLWKELGQYLSEPHAVEQEADGRK